MLDEIQNQGTPAPEEAQVEQTPEENQVEEQAQEAAAPAADPAAEQQLNKLENQDTSKMNKTQKAVHEKKLEKYKLKVYGRDVEEELDLNDRDAVTKKLQMAAAANQKMQEAQELRKSAEEFINLLRTNPRKVLSDPNINVDLKKLAQDYIDEQIANAQKSPEQLKIEELQRQLEERVEAEKKGEETRKKQEFERLTREHEEKIQVNIESALKTSDLPKTPYTVRKMAEMMMLALQNNVDLSPQDLAPIIRKQMQSDIKELFGAASDDVLEELVGRERIASIRKKKVAAVKSQQVAQTASSVKSGAEKPAATEKSEQKKIDMKKWLNS